MRSRPCIAAVVLFVMANGTGAAAAPPVRTPPVPTIRVVPRGAPRPTNHPPRTFDALPIATPTLTHSARGTESRVPEGTLFADRVRPSAVLQGQLGSCFFLSPVTAIAQRRPDLVRRRFTEMPDGTVVVRLFKRSGDARKGPLVPVDVRITREVPHADGTPFYVRTSDESTWPLLLEKAYAAVRGGYVRVNEGGYGSEALEALTGRPAEFIPFDRRGAPGVLARIEAAVRDGKPVTAGTGTQAMFGQGLRRLKERGPSDFIARLTQADGDRPKMMRLGLVPTHEYTVLGIGTKNGEKRIVLRNPWGTYTPPRGGWGNGEVDTENNGVFALSFEEFAAFFGDASIGELPPPEGAAAANETSNAPGDRR